MSTIKSSSEHLTLNADGASKDIKFQANGVEKASISSAGAFTSTTIDATALTGALPAIDGSSLTGVAPTSATMPAGSILQVVQGELSGSVESSTGCDIVDVDITPKQADSDMLITVYVQWSILSTNGDTGDDWGMVMQRDGSAILGESQNNYFISGGGVDSGDWKGQGEHEYGVNYASKMDLDTGRSSGTSQITYNLRLHKADSSVSKTIRFMRDGWGGGGNESQRSKCIIIVQEVAT